jgi:beta-mannanase
MGDIKAEDYEQIYRSLYPGDALVDWLGLDIYNTGPNLNWGAPYWRSFDQALGEPYKAITAISGKPLVLPEVGCPEGGGSKAEWISGALTPQVASQFPQLKALVWFDVLKEEQWQLHSSASALEAWNRATGQARILSDLNPGP